MKTTNVNKFSAGEQVTYVDLFHATVMSDAGSYVLITFIGRGLIAGEPIQRRVAREFLEHGWNEIKPMGE